MCGFVLTQLNFKFVSTSGFVKTCGGQGCSVNVSRQCWSAVYFFKNFKLHHCFKKGTGLISHNLTVLSKNMEVCSTSLSYKVTHFSARRELILVLNFLFIYKRWKEKQFWLKHGRANTKWILSSRNVAEGRTPYITETLVFWENSVFLRFEKCKLAD